MSQGFSTVEATAILNHVMGKTSLVQPTQIDVALWVGDPGETGAGGAEAAGTYYARVATTPAGHWAVATGASIANSAAITFPTAGIGGWGTVDYVAIFDYNGGSPIFLGRGSLASSQIIVEGNTPRYGIGALTVTLD
jgi:hypothetical protein